VEDDANGGMYLTNSADVGINFKTKTPYFSSELGLFNGEGYHGSADKTNQLSGEWRLTGHLLGTGKDKAKSDKQYLNVSYFGQQNQADQKRSQNLVGDNDFDWNGVHAVYNQPEFLVAAQYIATQNAGTSYSGTGFSINGEARIAPKFDLIARYDKTDLDSGVDKKSILAGGVYHYNKNVNFIGNVLTTEQLKADKTKSKDTEALMLTAEVKW